MRAPTPSVQTLLTQAGAHAGAGRFELAIPIYLQVLQVQPRNVGAMAQLGYALMARGRMADAKEVLHRGLKIEPMNLAALLHMGLVCMAEADYAEAVRWFDRVLALRPNEPAALGAKAEACCMTGDYERAYALVERGMREAAPRPEMALTFARAAGRLGRGAEAIDALRRSLAYARMTPVTRALLQFRLGDLHDAAGEYDAAFAAYTEGHRLRSTGRWDPDAFSRQVDEVIGAWTAEAMRAAPASTATSDRPVFIVGMWRSGTTLVEQILSAHPGVRGGDERNDVAQAVKRWPGARGRDLPMLPDPSALTAERVEQVSREYLTRLEALDAAAPRVTDKMPINFLYLGLIGRLFPGARVIQCERDPLDTCLSCWCKLVGGQLNEYANDLRHLGRFWRDARRLMAHWAGVLELPRIEVAYEAIVDDVEGTSRRMVGFLGLEWDEACLRFHENRRVARTASLDQVRRPLYRSSVGRWKNYEKHLGPLIEEIERA